MTPYELLAAARRLVELPACETEGVWARASALLGRQALEAALHDILVARAPGAQTTPFTTQLLLLRVLHEDKELAARIAYTWSALSRATHFQGYELPPTADALRAWLTSVDALLAEPT